MKLTFSNRIIRLAGPQVSSDAHLMANQQGEVTIEIHGMVNDRHYEWHLIANLPLEEGDITDNLMFNDDGGPRRDRTGPRRPNAVPNEIRKLVIHHILETYGLPFPVLQEKVHWIGQGGPGRRRPPDPNQLAPQFRPQPSHPNLTQIAGDLKHQFGDNISVTVKDNHLIIRDYNDDFFLKDWLAERGLTVEKKAGYIWATP